MELTGEPWSWALVSSMFVFASVCGANDGATLLALGVRITGLSILSATLLLSSAVVVAPFLIGTAVATTFLDGLVDFEGQFGAPMLVAVGASLITILLLGWSGRPTSLTVALFGGLVGAGIGWGLDVQWGTVGLVVLIAMLAPGIGFAGAYLVSRAAMWVDVRGRVDRVLSRLHVGAFIVLSLAYGVNDGQKMVAVMLVVVGPTSLDWGTHGIYMMGIGFFFVAGTLVAVRRYARSLVLRVVPIRSANAVAAEIAAASTILGTGLVGNPVSMTQTLVASVIGSGTHEGARRVRWREAAGIAMAWLYTFPFTLALGVGIAWGLRWIA